MMMRTALLVLVVCVLAVIVGAKNEEYAGWKVVRADLETEQQLAMVSSWGELDVWSRDSALVLGVNDIRVQADHIAKLEAMNVRYEIIVDDVQKLLNDFQNDLEESRKGSLGVFVDFFTAYHTYDEIGTFLKNLSASYSQITKFIPSIGTTIQGKSIYGIVITGNSGSNKQKLFFSGGQHAREWVGPATVLYIINQLVTGYGKVPTVTSLLDQTELHFIPLVNPDGYNFSWTSNRLWRKNRRHNSGGSYGVDLNRNWNDHWGGEGSSHTQTSDTYCGTRAFSEPESTAVSNYVTANGPFIGAIDYHSYSQLILRPYGWTRTAPPNEAVAKTVGDTIRQKILSVNNVYYTSEPSWQLYYTTGSAQDWYYSEADVPLSYTIELRDTGTYGFTLPASQIKPTGAENWAGFTYFVQAALDNSANVKKQ